MDEVIQRFPIIADKISKKLTIAELTECSKVSKLWRKFFFNKKDFWLEIIRLQYDGSSQLWKLEDGILKNKANEWKSNDKWFIFTEENRTYIINTSKDKVLTIKNEGKVIQEDHEEGSFDQHWITGKPDAEGYFTLESFRVPKFLTAISESTLEIEDRYGHLRAFRALWESVISQTSTEIVKKIALAVKTFFGTANYACEKEQYSPHHVVAAVGSKELYEYIANKTRIFNVRTSRYESTPLHYSAGHGHFEICKFIIESEDNKNPEDIRGITPLHVAATKGHLEICKLIVPKLEQKSPTDIFRKTPLHYAAKAGNFDTIHYLIDFVEDAVIEDVDEKTPQKYLDEVYENLKHNDFANPSPKSNEGKKKYVTLGWKYYARNGKVRKRTFVYRKRALDYSDHIMKI